jgi:chorismate lyase/3-hydroxybenzoate synthase
MELLRNTAAAPAPLNIVSTASAGRTPPAEPGENVLACMRFGLAVSQTVHPRLTPIGLGVVAGEDGCDVHTLTLSSRLPVSAGQFEDIHYADNGELLFGWMHIPEAGLADLEGVACETHLRLQRLLRARGNLHWLRAWNYLADINAGEGDEERYRRFTAGRHRALAGVFAGESQFERLLPAATAIGTPAGAGLTLCFLAGRTPGIQVENPRQVSAFEYPRRYGPRSPSFSRATLHHWVDRSILFVSGTASIVGHATLHPGDAAAQFGETLCNLEALLVNAAREHFPGGQAGRFLPRAFKLYVRDRQALAALGARWREALAAHAPTAVLIGGLCRRDLLVEVEAIYERPHA